MEVDITHNSGGHHRLLVNDHNSVFSVWLDQSTSILEEPGQVLGGRAMSPGKTEQLAANSKMLDC